MLINLDDDDDYINLDDDDYIVPRLSSSYFTFHITSLRWFAVNGYFSLNSDELLGGKRRYLIEISDWVLFMF